MPYITVTEANAWADQSKLNLETLDSELEASLADQVLSAVSRAYDVSSWLDESTTPSIVRKIIAMLYVGWYYQRTYSEDEETNSYGLMLIAQAERLMEGLATGTLEIPELAGLSILGSAGGLQFEPVETDDGPVFSMGTIW